MTSIKSQIAAARALADAATADESERGRRECITEVYELADRLASACELLLERSHEDDTEVRAFLAGEVKP